MLLRFRVTNFRSIRDEQELSLVAGSGDDLPDAVMPALPGVDVVRAAGIYGANASGKSNVLAALRFAADAVKRSQSRWAPDGGIPVEPFLLSQDSISAPSRFVVDLALDGVRFEYGFSLNSQVVLEEWLAAYPHGRRQVWFLRHAGAPKIRFGRALGGPNRIIESLTRPNSLFLSAAFQANHAGLSSIGAWFSRVVSFSSDSDRVTGLLRSSEAMQDSRRRESIISLLRVADLGITGAAPVDPDSDRREFDRVLRELGLLDRSPTDDLAFHHRGGDGVAALQWEQQSAGTQTIFKLAALLRSALDEGGLLLIDELDASLHPAISTEIVRMFNSSAASGKAQLVFSTHDTNLLDREVLRRDQIWFTEKDGTGATHLIPLTDFRPRRLENVQRGYLMGRYGAIPFVDRDALHRFAGEE